MPTSNQVQSMIKKYDNLSDLLKKELIADEYDFVENVISSVSNVKKEKYFNKEQFLKMAMWKSPRPKQWYESNSDEDIFKVSKEALNCSDEHDKIELLTSLKGVSVPVASAILTLIDPVNYGVIDIRVWQTLYLYGDVKGKQIGRGLNIDDWCLYLSILKKYAKEFNVKVRDIERTLFAHHQEIQEGTLY